MNPYGHNLVFFKVHQCGNNAYTDQTYALCRSHDTIHGHENMVDSKNSLRLQPLFKQIGTHAFTVIDNLEIKEGPKLSAIISKNHGNKRGQA